MYDVAIIGAGVSGCAIARELSRYRLSVCVLEKEEDVCCGTSKANSAIVHSGVDAKPGSLKAKLNVYGNALMAQWSSELDFPFRRNGSLILCFQEEERQRLEALYEQGLKNHVPDLRIVEKEELHRLEPAVSGDAIAALYAPSGGIVCPFGLTIALAENAASNGVEFLFHTEITNISPVEQGYCLSSLNGTITARCVINAAGTYGDTFHNMVSRNKIHITPRRGEYCLLDKTAGDLVSHTIFQLPNAYGKGVLVTPTIHGNLLIGPTADDHLNKESNATTQAGLDRVCKDAARTVPAVPLRSVITSFAGNRAHEDGNEFMIGEPEDAKGFIDCAGIESPGLSSAPAIGIYVSELVCKILSPSANKNFCGKRKGILDPRRLPRDKYAALIQNDKAYGNIICRCEMITEGEILDAIRRPLGAKSLDGVKRRVRAGMGRCQGGFCSPKVMEILSKELGISQLDITKSGGTSFILKGHLRENHPSIESKRRCSDEYL